MIQSSPAVAMMVTSFPRMFQMVMCKPNARGATTR